MNRQAQRANTQSQQNPLANNADVGYPIASENGQQSRRAVYLSCTLPHEPALGSQLAEMTQYGERRGYPETIADLSNCWRPSVFVGETNNKLKDGHLMFA